MSTLTKIVSLAKKLKKEAPNKFAKWTDYIKEASKKIKPVVKKAKKVAKKVTKKVKKKLGETHTDKNSHNVKLNIYSGTGLRKDENTLSYAKPNIKSINGIDELNKCLNEYNKIKKAIEFNETAIKNKYLNPLSKKLNKILLANNKKYLILLRKQITQIKKTI